MKDLLLSRRSLLRWSAAGLAALAAPRALFAQGRPGGKVPVALQLYSVRGDTGKNMSAALEQVAKMGFQGVEFAGYANYGSDAAGLRKRLDDLGLKAAGTHVGAKSLVGDALKKTVDFHKTIGCSFLICPGDGRFTDPEKSKELAEELNKAAEALKGESMFCGYHNHKDEFKKAEGDKTYWDLFAERTSKDVILQQDVGWTTAAGLDPIALVKKYPGRTRTTHIKAKTPKNAEGKKPFVGQDSTDWKGYVAACYEVGGTDWFTLEQEDYPDGLSPMECVKLSLDGFKKILADSGK